MSFEKCLDRAQARVSSMPNEPKYIKRYLPKIVSHIKELIAEKPGITKDEIEKKLFDEIDDYSTTVYEASYVYSYYMDYILGQYLKEHKDKYLELSESLKNSAEDLESKKYIHCKSFDEYLTLYIYNINRELLKCFFARIF